MKSYEFKLTIEEGNDEFWEAAEGSGCKEVEDLLKEMLAHYGFDESNSNLKLTMFKDE